MLTSNYKQLTIVGVILLMISSNTFSAEPTLTVKPVLTLEVAKVIARECEARQIEIKHPPVSIAIFDQGGNLVLFHRMMGSSLGAVAVALEKGKTAANFPVSTKQWEAATYGDKGSPGIAFLPNITTIAGGIPIVSAQGVHLGGIGVSGSSSDDDEACAMAGLDGIKKLLSQNSDLRGR